jgi:small subunit ribosomal protein S6
MINYELVCIYRKEDDKCKAGRDAVAEIMKKHSVQPQKEEDMGLKELAYDIQKQAQGHYALYEFAAEPTVMKDMDHSLRMENNLLKYMIVKK